MTSQVGDVKFRVGHGFDVHRLEPYPPNGRGKALRLGGIVIDDVVGLGPVGKTDADVLVHALIEAMLGAIARHSMGDLFSRADPRSQAEDSRVYLEEAVQLLKHAGWHVGNLDATVVLESPRLKHRKQAITESLARLIGETVAQINVKFKTRDGLDSVGKGLGIEAYCVVLVERIER